MPIEVEGPDGKVHPFPDGTSQQQISQQMSSVYGGRSGALQPTSGLPAAGSPTAASGAVMPSMQTTPPYATDEDRTNIALSMLLPRGSVSAMQNTPGHAYRMAQAKKSGENMGNLEERQRGGTQVLEMLNQLGHTADEGQASGNLESAIGPLDSSPTFQRVRAAIPLVGSYYEKPYNLHNQLMHDIHGLTTAFISSAGKGGITMSDARQKAFEETMGAMMKSTSKEEFDKIKTDAERIIRNTFGLEAPKLEPRKKEGAAPEAARPQQYINPQTKEVIEWDGKGWVRVR